MIHTVIFDLDGVVVNSEPIHQALEDKMYKELGIQITPELKKAVVGTSSMDAWKKIIKEYNLSHKPEDLLMDGRRRYLEMVKRGEVKLMEGILELLEILRKNNFLLLMASSATEITIQTVLAYHKLEDYFKYFIGGDQVTRSKPDPEIFTRVAATAGVPVYECVVIEDSTNGVIAAKLAGMTCIALVSSFTGDQDLNAADRKVHHLSEITLDMIRNLNSR